MSEASCESGGSFFKKHKASAGKARARAVHEGVGELRLHLSSVRLLADCRDDHVQRGSGTAAGDHYVRFHVAPSRDCAKLAPNALPPPGYSKLRRTHTVYQSSCPRFDARWHLPVYTFGSEIRLELVDAAPAFAAPHRTPYESLSKETTRTRARKARKA